MNIAECPSILVLFCSCRLSVSEISRFTFLVPHFFRIAGQSPAPLLVMRQRVFKRYSLSFRQTSPGYVD
jgi:hypothetical protein